jgi:hypothetical protein
VKRNCASDNGEHNTRRLPLQISEKKWSLPHSEPVLPLILTPESSISSSQVRSKKQTQHLLFGVTEAYNTNTDFLQ